MRRDIHVLETLWAKVQSEADFRSGGYITAMNMEGWRVAFGLVVSTQDQVTFSDFPKFRDQRQALQWALDNPELASIGA